MGLETWNIWESWAGNVISAKKKKKSLFLQEAVFYAKMAFFFFFLLCRVTDGRGIFFMDLSLGGALVQCCLNRKRSSRPLSGELLSAITTVERKQSIVNELYSYRD